VSLRVKPVGEPDAGNLHVRFDERGSETEPWNELRHRRMAKAAGNCYSSFLSVTAPILDSTSTSERASESQSGLAKPASVPTGCAPSRALDIGVRVSLSRSRAVLIANRRGRIPSATSDGLPPRSLMDSGYPPSVQRGGQGGHRKVASEEPEARSRAVTNAPEGRREPVGQAEDAEPAARWRRHILDESAGHGVCGQHGTVAVERSTWGSLAGSVGMGSAVADHISKGDRSWFATRLRGGTQACSSVEARVMPRDPSPGWMGPPDPKRAGTVRRGEARRVT
jgi:hypothetical protein